MRTALAAVLLLTLTACGATTDGKDTGSEANKVEVSKTPTKSAEPEYPKCDDVWVAGKTLPANYDGCLNGDAVEVYSAFDCNDGKTQLGSYQDRFWVVTPDGTIADVGAGKDTASDPEYAKAYDDCN